MSLEEYPQWIRGIDVFIGLVTVLVGAWVLFSPDLVEATLVVSVAIGLFLIGVVRFGKGISLNGLAMSSRVMKIASGIGAIVLSLLSFVFSSLTVTFLITLLTFAIMLVGLSRIVVGYGEKESSTWLRWTNIIGGGVVFFFGFFAAIFSGLGFFTLRLMLSCVFIVLGLIRIAAASKSEMI
ncbi:MAG: DUF308 domain-containing protein [Candidatus Thorarchaeota archaeon]|nr:DUF308 domain-containing protein [Candidatus Thorarchaeota archaeon]